MPNCLTLVTLFAPNGAWVSKPLERSMSSPSDSTRKSALREQTCISEDDYNIHQCVASDHSINCWLLPRVESKRHIFRYYRLCTTRKRRGLRSYVCLGAEATQTRGYRDVVSCPSSTEWIRIGSGGIAHVWDAPEEKTFGQAIKKFLYLKFRLEKTYRTADSSTAGRYREIRLQLAQYATTATYRLILHHIASCQPKTCSTLSPTIKHSFMDRRAWCLTSYIGG